MINTTSMQVVQAYGKSKQLLESVIRSTSCSRGWLRLVVQAIFGIIIVSSFIMILGMAVGSSSKEQVPEQRCNVEACRVICNDVPVFGEFEDNVVHALASVDINCGRILLTLNQPMFNNNTLDAHWLSGIRVNVSELEIIGGNLRHIQPNSFMTHFGSNIRVLVLEKISISTLAPDTFLGLSALEELYIKDSLIINLRQNALQAIDDTLQILKINAINCWNPINVTGSSHLGQLRIVDFSINIFNDILGRNSFSGLRKCRVLFLNSCKIKSIGVGAFDSLESIEIIHLNDNYLVTVPADLFKNIITLKPRISLQNNQWQCNCFNENFRILSKLDLLIVDPICYYPIALRGLTFSKFENYCENNSVVELIGEELHLYDGKSNTITNQQCEENSSTVFLDVSIRSPLPEYECSYNSHEKQKSIIVTDVKRFSSNNWLKPKFAVDINGFSMVTIVFSEPYDFGLMWYKSSCPNDIYCINHLPKSLRVYNQDSSIEYTFCRVFFTSGIIRSDTCTVYDRSIESSAFFYKSVLLYACIGIICLLSGALCVYALIHKNPSLLKGNKRVVFVKHKTVDALVLPPKISSRCDMGKDSYIANKSNSNIFAITENQSQLVTENFMRSNSVKTIDSNDPSYISALQPTEDQLAEWRIARHFDVKRAYDSIDSNRSIQSEIPRKDSWAYYSLDSNSEKIYDTIIL